MHGHTHTCTCTGTQTCIPKALNNNWTNEKDKNPKCVKSSLWKPSGYRVNLSGLCVRMCICACLCVRARESERERWPCPIASLWPTTTGNRFGIICHIHYSTGHEYQRGRKERERCRRPANHHNKPYLPYHTIC